MSPPTTTLCHRLSPGWRLSLTLLVLVLTVWWDENAWLGLTGLTLVVLVGLSAAHVPVESLVLRLGGVLPPLFLLALTARSNTDLPGWYWLAGLWLRCALAFLAVLWLIHVLPATELLATLRRWRVPLILVGGLELLHRSFTLSTAEFRRLSRARQARTSRPTGALQSIRLWLPQFRLAAQRARLRSRRMHQAVLARGWDGSVRSLDDD